jgi:adenylate cyclase class IV
LKSKASALNLDSLFDLNVPIDEIRAEVARKQIATEQPNFKQIEKARAEFEANYQRIQQLTSLLSKPRLSPIEIRDAINKKKLSSIQRDLIKNNQSDTYFLPPCNELLERPSLVLLRHIYTCPIEYVYASERGDSAPERLVRLDSPFVESLMSKFASLFTRVGTRDIPDSVVQSFFLPD